MTGPRWPPRRVSHASTVVERRRQLGWPKMGVVFKREVRPGAASLVQPKSPEGARVFRGFRAEGETKAPADPSASNSKVGLIFLFFRGTFRLNPP